MADEIRVGDKIRDNDPRMRGRVLTVVEVLPERVLARWYARPSRILRRRIYTDDKPRRTGFSLVREVSRG